LPDSVWDQIDDVVAFSGRTKLNYDCLNAIASELALWYPFKEVIRDMNILNTENPAYNAEIIFSNGQTLTMSRIHLNHNEYIYIYPQLKNGHEFGRISIAPNSLKYDLGTGKYYVDKEYIDFYAYDPEDSNEEKVMAEFNTLAEQVSLHYML